MVPQVKTKKFKFNTFLANHRWLKRISIGALALFFLYVVGGFFGVPLALRYLVLPKINNTLTGAVEIEDFRCNPFTWELEIKGVQARTADGEVAASFAQLKINVQPSSIFGEAYVVRELLWDQPSAALLINPEGKVNLSSLFSTKEAPKKTENTEPFVIPPLVIEKLEVRNAGFLMRMETSDPTFEREIKNISFVINDLRTDPDHENPYHFSLETGEGEKLEIKGSVSLDPLSSVGSVSVGALKVSSFSSFGSNQPRAKIDDGILDLYFDYQFQPLRSQPLLGINNGRLSLKDFSLVGPNNDRPIHRIGSLRLEGFSFDAINQTTQLDSLSIDQASLQLVRGKEGGFRLLEKAPSQNPTPSRTPNEIPEADAQDREILLGIISGGKDMGEPLTAATRKMRTLGSREGKSQGGQLPVAARMETFLIKNSTIRIRDESTQPAVGFEIKDIEMTAGPYVSNQPQQLNLDLTMTLANGASGKIEAKGNALATAPFKSSRLEISVDGVTMPSFAGYLVPVVGRASIAGGLQGKLIYRIENGLLEGSNDLEIRKIEFGPRVENTKAPNLPLKLAIAVLENPDGTIAIDIPVSGDISDPKFSSGKIISYAIQNMIQKIATAPFSALSRLFPDSKGVQNNFIEFGPGQSRLPDEAGKILGKMGKIMGSRPNLLIELTPSYLPEKDSTALSELRFERSIEALIAKGEDRKGAIKELHKRLPKKQQVSNWGFADFKETEQAVRKSLTANEGDLQKLAEERAQSVRQAIVSEGGIDASRIEIITPAGTGSKQVVIGLDAIDN